MKSTIQKRFYSRQEVAEALGCSIPTVARRLADGSIPSTHLGSRVLVPASYLDTLEQSAATRTQGA